jgi:hypothetical protein
MSYIKLLVDKIDDESMQKVLNYYNANKPANENKLELLNRAEGGFKIQIPEREWKINPYIGFADANDKVQQMRWNKGKLVSSRHIDFTLEQYMLLYESLSNALPGNVILEE